jgi:carbon-monoxide dehydrogenase medium subunit
MPSTFDYVRARSAEEALCLLQQADLDAKVLAGGTDLLTALRHGKACASTLVDISDVEELSRMEVGDQGLYIGACTKIADIVRSSLIRSDYGVVYQAARELGSSQIRNLATIGGNLCNAAPSAEMAGPLLALDAHADIRSTRGRRLLPLAEFFVGPGKTCVGRDELLVGLLVPEQSRKAAGVYLRHSVNRAMNLATVAVTVVGSGAHRSRGAQIILSAVAPTPMHAARAEQYLSAQVAPTAWNLAHAARLASEESRPISDVRASADYRREMVRVLTERALAAVLA